MELFVLNKNYVRFGILIGCVIVINLMVFSHFKSLPQPISIRDGLEFDQQPDKQLNIETRELNKGLNSKSKIFCIVKTHPKNIESGKTLTVLNVWVHKCDNYRFISLLPEKLRPVNYSLKSGLEVEIDQPFHILQPRLHFNETHDKLTDKLYHSFESIYKHFPDYDWYYVSDDDAYVNVNNLRTFIEDKNSSEPMTFGFEFQVIVKGGYHSGGPGYAVSGEAFRRLGKKLVEDYKSCKNSGTDDVDINDCLRAVGARMEKSVDEKGRQRWLCLSLMDFYSGNFPDWLKQYSSHPLKSGFDCCSDSLIAVHYMSPREVVRLDIAIEIQENTLRLYDKYIQLGKKITSKDIIKNFIRLGDFENDKN